MAEIELLHYIEARRIYIPTDHGYIPQKRNRVISYTHRSRVVDLLFLGLPIQSLSTVNANVFPALSNSIFLFTPNSSNKIYTD